MLSSLLRDNDAGAGGETDADTGFLDKEVRYYRWKWWHLIIVLLILFPYICIPILFALVANCGDETNKTNKNYYYTDYTTSSLASSTGSSLEDGMAVSLTSNGALQVGAGTSIYKNVVDLSTLCPSYLSLIPLFSNTYLLSYADKVAASNATLQVITIDEDAPNIGTVAAEQAVGYYIYEIATLSAEDGTFVGICQDLSAEDETAYIISGKVDPDTYDIQLQRSDQPYAAEYSVDPVLTTLSTDSFAIAYYNYVANVSNVLETRFGTVDTDTLAISLSNGTAFADDSQNSHTFTAVGLSETQYLLVYYNASVPDPTYEYYGYGPLNAMLATVPAGVPAINANVSLGSTITLIDSAASFVLAATSVDNVTALIAYADASSNYGIQVQQVQLLTELVESADGTTTSDAIYPVFGSSWAVTSGGTLSAHKPGAMEIDIAAISDNKDFLVLYSDTSNNAIMTATAGQVTSSGKLVRTSPDFLLNSGNNDLSAVFSWGALAAGDKTAYSTQTAIMYALTDEKDCTTDATSMFAIMEVLPAAFGVTPPSGSSARRLQQMNQNQNQPHNTVNADTSLAGDTPRTRQMIRASTSSDASGATATATVTDAGTTREGGRGLASSTTEVVVAGTADGWGSAVVETGLNYYTNTMGTIFSSGTYYGRDAGSGGAAAASLASEYYYVYDADTDTIVTTDARVGFGAADGTLYVQTS